MHLIVGLGNPTKQYEGTRHNVGFETIDRIAAENQIRVEEKKHKALYGSGYIEGEKVILAKPQTFMNLSGESVRELSDYYKIPAENIILHLGTEVFPRIKVGVGEKPKGWDLADYVLGRYSAEDRKIIDEAQKEAAEAVKMMVMDDVRGAMNRYNTKKKA